MGIDVMRATPLFRGAGRLLPALALLWSASAAAEPAEPAPGAPPPAPAASPSPAASPGPAASPAQTCYGCHDGLEHPYSLTAHAKAFAPKAARTEAQRRDCDSCHGDSTAHVAEGGGKGVGNLITFRRETPAAAAREDAICLSCHQGGHRTAWAGSAHDDQGCVSCHTVMKAVSPAGLLERPTVHQTCATCHPQAAAQTFQRSHMPLHEGPMSCTSCHQPHGTVTPALLPTMSTNDLCYRCHADKRGPFLWEHAPVAENCLNCHVPHGSTRERMLVTSQPRLCQQCHIETSHPTEARQPTNKFVIGHSCTQCHMNIHGSNHPSGFAYTR